MQQTFDRAATTAATRSRLPTFEEGQKTALLLLCLPGKVGPMVGAKSPMPTGIAPLDHVLGGGLPRDRIYLVQGDPGSGKTTLAVQFLLEGMRRKEPVLYVTLSETKEELRDVAASHGWSLDGIDVVELSNLEDSVKPDGQYTLFDPADVELGETTRRLLEVIERVKPVRLVFDSLSELRLLARDPLRYRRQILAFKQFFIGKKCTALFLDDGTSSDGDLQLQSLAHGVFVMEQLAPEYGAERRRLRVVKLRGVKYRGGFHDFTIEKGGISLFPRLVAAEHQELLTSESVTSGLPALDALCDGGLHRGSSTLVLGPAGSGKSTICTQFAMSSVERGERCVVFAFDEGQATLLARASGLGMPLQPHFEAGTLRIKQIDPAELSPGQFTNLIQEEVRLGARMVIIDSINGYLHAMPEERFLLIQMHELLTFLNQAGVVSLITMAQHGLVGDRMASPVDLSYLADTAFMLRFFEHDGTVRKAISVIKRRRGNHETTIRELRMTSKGLVVGEPLAGFRGVLTGVPVLTGARRPLDGDGV
jgi:circadian clock protein KaiC